MRKKIGISIALVIAISSVLFWQYERFAESNIKANLSQTVDDVEDDELLEDDSEEEEGQDWDQYYVGYCTAYPLFQQTYFPYKVGYNFHPMYHTGPFDRYSGELGSMEFYEEEIPYAGE